MEECAEIAQKIGNRLRYGEALCGLALVEMRLAEYPASRAHLQDAIEIYRGTQSIYNLAYGYASLGDLSYLEGEYTKMGRYFQDCLAIAEENGYPIIAIWALHHIGVAARYEGHHEQAAQLMLESLNRARALQAKQFLLEGLAGMASLNIDRGKIELAARLLSFVEAQGMLPLAWFIPEGEYRRDLAALKFRMEPGAFQAAWEEGRGMTLEEAVEQVID